MLGPDVDEWTSMPSISVTNCGSVFSGASTRPKSSRRPAASQLLNRRHLHALRPILNQSLLGQRVAAMRRRRSSRTLFEI